MSNTETRKVDRKYSSLARSIWNHPKFKRLPAPKPNAQTLLFRLLIAPESNSIPGLFQAFRGGLCDALEWSTASFDRCFRKLEEEGWVDADWRVGLVWVPGAIEQDGNQPANPNVVRSWRGPLAELPDCELKQKALQELSDWATRKGDAWVTALEEALGKRNPMTSPNPSGKTLPKNEPKPLAKPSAKTRPKQEQEQENEQEAGAGNAPAGGLTGSGFSRFTAFERSMGKPPSPRKDPLGERLPFAKWFPSQQWLDWFREAGIGPELQDTTLIQARDKLTGSHDVEWWDMMILRFFDSAIRRNHSTNGPRAEVAVLSP